MQTKHNTTRRGNQAGRVNIHDASGRVVGYVRNRTFHKTITASRHLLRTPPSICFDVVSLHEVEAAHGQYIEVTDRENGTVWRAALGTVWAKGRRLDRGHGEQWSLGLAWWAKDGEPRAEQMALAI
jgi:hypothetical protein